MYILSINEHIVQIGDELSLEGEDGTYWKIRDITPEELIVDEWERNGSRLWSDMHIPIQMLADAPSLNVKVIKIGRDDYPYRNPNLAFKFREKKDENSD